MLEISSPLRFARAAQILSILSNSETKLIGNVCERILYTFSRLIARSMWMRAWAMRRVWVTSSLVSWHCLHVNAGITKFTLRSSNKSLKVLSEFHQCHQDLVCNRHCRWSRGKSLQAGYKSMELLWKKWNSCVQQAVCIVCQWITCSWL